MMRATAHRLSWACQLRLTVDKPAKALSRSAVTVAPVRCYATLSPGQYERGVERFVREDEVDAALHHVAEQSETWHRVSATERIRILEAIRDRCIKCSIHMGRRGAQVRSSLNLGTMTPRGDCHACVHMPSTTLQQWWHAGSNES